MTQTDEPPSPPPAPSDAKRIRVMLRIAPEFTAPGLISDIAFWPFGLCTASVAPNALDALAAHPGVLSVSLPLESRTVRLPLADVPGKMPDVGRDEYLGRATE